MIGVLMKNTIIKTGSIGFAFRFSGFLYALLILCCPPPVHASAVITVGVVKDSKPMSWYNNNGVLVGFNVDVAHALCNALKVSCRIRVAPLAELIDDVAANRVDFVAASLLETEERAKKMLFTIPYYRSTSYLIAKKGTTLQTAGLKIAAQNGSRQQEYLKAHVSKTAALVAFPTLVAIGEGLADGSVNAALLPMPMAIGLMEDPRLIIAGYTVISVDIPELMGEAKIGVTRSKPELRERLNAALKTIRIDGQLERINSKHLPFSVI